MTDNRARSRSPTSFSPTFDKFAAYGDKEPHKQSNEPYGKRADMRNPAYTLSPEVNRDQLLAVTQVGAEHLLNKQQPPKKSLLASLPVPVKQPQAYQLRVLSSDNKEVSIQIRTNEAEGAMASFTIREKPGNKFPWALVNDDTGLEVAFYKFKKSNVPNHLEQQAKNHVNLELYGKTPLYEHQSYKKKDGTEIIYPWASISQRHASKMFGLFPVSESIEMTTKHEVKLEYKVYQQLNHLKIHEIKRPIGMKKKSITLEKKGGDKTTFSIIIEPQVDPLLMIAFLVATRQLA
jgi:hypothetical protein